MEILEDIGNICTLEWIELYECSDAATNSARYIQKIKRERATVGFRAVLNRSTKLLWRLVTIMALFCSFFMIVFHSYSLHCSLSVTSPFFWKFLLKFSCLECCDCLFCFLSVCPYLFSYFIVFFVSVT